MKKRITALLLCISVIFSGTAYAAKSVSQLKDDLSANQKKAEQAKKQIQSKQAEKNSQKAQKDALDVDIANLQGDIDEVQAVIDDKNAEIQAKSKEITALDNELKKTDKQLKKRMKVVYESGTTSYLELILQADGVSDLFTRLSVVESILKHDNEMMDVF